MTYIVSDHAIVRYLERVMHLDMDKVREDIRAQAEQGTPAGEPPIGGVAIIGPTRKAACIVQRDTIVTVLGVREMRRAAKWIRARVQ